MLGTLVIHCLILSLMKVCGMIFLGSGSHFQDSCLELPLTCPERRSHSLNVYKPIKPQPNLELENKILLVQCFNK